MHPVRYADLNAAKLAAFKTAAKFQKPVHLWECRYSINGGRFAFKINCECPPAPNAKYLGFVLPGVRIKGSTGLLYRAGIFVRASQCQSSSPHTSSLQ